MRTADLAMTRAQAAEELEKYQGGDTPEDKLIAKAYRALKGGKRLLDLHDSMRLAGCDDLGRPKLAVGRADWKVATFRGWKGNDNVMFRKEDGYSYKQVVVPAKCLPGLVYPEHGFRLEAPTPLIPPRYRPAQGNLRNYWILWEAAWRDIPVDPLLLQHIGGPLYLVLAAWDLTPVERAVLRGTR